MHNLFDGSRDAGRLNDSFFLNDDTVADDLAADQVDMLTGNAGDDWFIYRAGEDKVNGMSGTEAQQDLTIT